MDHHHNHHHHHHHLDEQPPSGRLNEMMMTSRVDDTRHDLVGSVTSTSGQTIDHQSSLGGAASTNLLDGSWPLSRLINETFVSLPLSRCIDLVATTTSRMTRRDSNRLCLIDWTRSKITTTTSWPDNAPKSESEPELEPESSFSVYQQLINNHQPELRTSGALARLVYLSSSSLLSLVGIVTNLLILLIIVINTKQKCQHFLSRTSHTTSHTNYHYVLLFQLTLTGLLLGGYVLFSTSSQLYLATTTRPYDNLPAPSDHEQNCNILLSPMSIYLPHIAATQVTAASKLAPATSWAILKPETDFDGEILSSNTNVQLTNKNNITEMIEEPSSRKTRVVITPVRCQENGQEPAAAGTNSIRAEEILFNLVACIHLWTVAALAYDRYCAIAYPLEYLRAINAARAKTFLIILWSGAFLTNVLSPLALDKWLRYAIEKLNMVATTTDSHKHHHHHLRCMLSTNAGEEQELISWAISSLPLCLSCLTFALIILLPLVCVTICNVSIYGIVKVHERRLSASSGSQSSSGGAGSSGPGCANLGAMASVASKLRLIEPTSPFYHNNNNNNNNKEQQLADKNADDSSSLASSILGKLIRSSAQVGSLGGAHVDRRHSNETFSGRSASSDDDEDLPEISNLIGATEDGDSSSSCKSSGDQQKFDQVSKSASAGGQRAPMCSTIVNRSRRLSSLNKLGRTKSKQQLGRQENAKATVDVTQSRIRFLRRSKRKLKRKLSDKEPSLPAGLNRSVSRRGSSSFAPSSWTEQALLMGSGGGGGNNQQAQDCFCQADNCSMCNNGCNTGVRLLSRNNSRQLDSDGILRQIKMAGLSFAGIAINELMQPPPGHMRAPTRRTTLNRSSSCSLGNLTNYACCQCDQQRSSVMVNTNKKESFVSLNMKEDTPGACHQDKYSTRLHSELHPNSSQNSASTRSQTTASCQQHFNFGGTKSIAFNVVVWLILILLICSLPQYCLLLINLSQQPFHSQVNVVSLLRDLLQKRLDTATTIPQDNVEQPVWLAYTCRLLFLLMLPLNAWLYGIRSRSLKTTLRMVLRRYISKRQASIEINQRRKSNLSTRSRDSSLMSCRTNSRNSSLFFQTNQQQQQASQPPYNAQNNNNNNNNNHPHPQQLGCTNGRVFRRCASFNLPPTINQQHPICQHHHQYQCLRTNGTSAFPTTKQPDQQSQRSHTNSIRFVLGGDDHASAARTHDDPKAPLLPDPNASHQQYMLSIPSQSVASSQNSISLNSSLASSRRSLLSASILSSHSAAFLLVNNQPKHEESGNGKSAPGSAHQLLATKPLTSVLKKRDSRSSMINHQDSFDSACSEASQKSVVSRSRARPTLDRVHSSPGKLLVGVARPRSLTDNKKESSLMSTPPVAAKQRKQIVRQKAQDESPQSVEGVQICDDDKIKPPPGHMNERRPSSDIRLLLTSAEDESTGETSHACTAANTTDLLLLNCDTNCHERPNAEGVGISPIVDLDGIQAISGPRLDSNNNSNNETGRFQLEYYKQIKDAIRKYFLSRKAYKQGAATRKDSDISQFSFVSGKSDGPQESSLAAPSDDCTAVRPQACGVPLSRRSSLDSQVVWHRNKTHHHLLGHHHHHNHHQHGVRRASQQLGTTSNPVANNCVPVSASGSSLAIKPSNSIDSITSECHNQLASRHVAQQNSHLRPPNSLKLLLDPDNQQATLYASSLALSPIKETSSYASSNSSLNNQQQQQQQLKPQQHVVQ